LDLRDDFLTSFPFETHSAYRADLGAFSTPNADFRVDDRYAPRRHLNGTDRAFADANLAPDAPIGDDLGGLNPFFVPGHEPSSLPTGK
jgi:hypothetical protein